MELSKLARDAVSKEGSILFAAGSGETPVQSCASRGCFHADNVETLASDSSGILAACFMFSDYIEMFLKVSM